MAKRKEVVLPVGTRIKVKMRALRALLNNHREWSTRSLLRDFLVVKGKKHDLILTITDTLNPYSEMLRKEGRYCEVNPLNSLEGKWYIPTSVFEVLPGKKK